MEEVLYKNNVVLEVSKTKLSWFLQYGTSLISIVVLIAGACLFLFFKRPINYSADAVIKSVDKPSLFEMPYDAILIESKLLNGSRVSIGDTIMVLKNIFLNGNKVFFIAKNDGIYNSLMPVKAGSVLHKSTPLYFINSSTPTYLCNMYVPYILSKRLQKDQLVYLFNKNVFLGDAYVKGYVKQVSKYISSSGKVEVQVTVNDPNLHNILFKEINVEANFSL